MNLEVVLANGDRSRELVRLVRIEGIPLGLNLLGDEHGERNARLRASTRLDHTVKGMDQHLFGSEMKRGMNIRIGDGRGLGESSDSETLGDGGSQKAVVLLRLLSEPEETEEDERAKDGSPSSGLQ